MVSFSPKWLGVSLREKLELLRPRFSNLFVRRTYSFSLGKECVSKCTFFTGAALSTLLIWKPVQASVEYKAKLDGGGKLETLFLHQGGPLRMYRKVSCSTGEANHFPRTYLNYVTLVSNRRGV